MDEKQQSRLEDLAKLIGESEETDVSQHDGLDHDFIAPETVGVAVPPDDRKVERALSDMTVEEAYVIGQLMGKYRANL